MENTVYHAGKPPMKMAELRATFERMMGLEAGKVEASKSLTHEFERARAAAVEMANRAVSVWEAEDAEEADAARERFLAGCAMAAARRATKT